MNRYQDFPVLLVNDLADASGTVGVAVDAISAALRNDGIPVIAATNHDDATWTVSSHPELGCALLGWDAAPVDEQGGVAVVPAVENLACQRLIAHIRSRNEHLPIFLITEHLRIEDLPPEILSQTSGVIWATEDVPEFVAGRIKREIDRYQAELLPPFFGRLLRYAEEYKYSWHTPGHAGGLAYRKSPAGRIFFDFFGENVFRTDLCSSVPELGSVLEHEGVVEEAEAYAARQYGADETYFVTNGTTMSNQIVFRGIVTSGDIVLLDRNCHKSIINSVIMCGAIPIFMMPVRNRHGMIGPIAASEMSETAIRAKLAAHPLIKNPDAHIRLAVLTNSTYDGTMYNAASVIDRIGKLVDFVFFDEAWIAYAAFHPLYRAHFAMGARSVRTDADRPTVIASMSTHKLLAAFSQASMIHIQQGRVPLPRERFNEAFMMHTSTSPQYGIIASIDVATKMMEGKGGETLMHDAISEAIGFRKELLGAGQRVRGDGDWWYDVWQPDRLSVGSDDPRETLTRARFADVPDGTLEYLDKCWVMHPGDTWHNFAGLADDYAMLDPTKVSIIMPGVREDGSIDHTGIPAGLVSTFLRERGIVSEKTGFYSMLMLFSIAITKGKSGTLLSELFEFKRLYDANAPIRETMRELYATYPERYEGVGLHDLGDEMHAFLSNADTGEMQEAIYRHLATPAITPAEASAHLMRGEVDLVPLDQLDNRISGVLCVLYPPGIPVVVPGERFDPDVHPVIAYLQLFMKWDAEFPGFENEMQGVVKERAADGSLTYSVYCVKETAV